MKLPAAPARAFVRALAVALAAALSIVLSADSAHAADPVAAVLDRTSAHTVKMPAAVGRAQDRLRRELGARALIQPDPRTGTPKIVARLDGFLTAPSHRSPEAIALDYVREHANAFGLDAGDIPALELAARERGPDGTVHLTWEQRSGGLADVDGGLHAAVNADGRLINVRGGTIPDPDTAAPEPRVSAARAYATALPGSASVVSATASKATERTTEFAGGGRASLVRYRDGGTDRLGWRVLIPASSSAFYDAIVDARTGRLQRRINRVRFASQINHYDVNPRAPSDSATIDDVPSEWLDSSSYLSGRYVHAVSDVGDRIKLASSSPPFPLTAEPDPDEDEVLRSSVYDPQFFRSDDTPCTQLSKLCTWTDSSNRTANRKFSTAQLFWYLNKFREHLAEPPIGFTGPGEFKDEDAVLAQALDGADTGPDSDHTSNSNMLVLPDGYRGLMQMYLFGPPFMGRYDGAMDASLVYHEYTHGLSERLVTDSQGFGTLSGPQPSAISEGTSDFYAMDYLVATEPDAVPDSPTTQGEVRVGQWLQSNPSLKGADAFRTEGLDCLVTPPADEIRCPGTSSAGKGGYDYQDFGRVLGAPETHADGEIWAQTLWDLRTALDVGRTRAYVTEGLRLAPEYPTFLDMRNAIVQAAVNLHGDQDWDAVWKVFADRGMGWSASTEGPNDLTPFEAYDMPPDNPAAPGGADGVVTDETSAPVVGARVAVAGHDSGLSATDLQATTGTNGHYALPPVPAGSYPDLYVRKPGFQEVTTGLNVTAGITTTTNFAPLRRDYASTSSGGSVFSFTGPNFSGDGCGPGQAIDDDKGTAWSTAANQPNDLVVDLGRRVDLRGVRIDPRAGCGDDPGSSLDQYELGASDGGGQPFERIAGGIVGPPDARGYVSLPLVGNTAGRRLLRLRAIAPRDPEAEFMDISELEVTGTPVPVAEPAPTPTSTPTPAPTPIPPPTPQLTELLSTKLTANRKGFFKVKVEFGDAAALGSARLTVFRKGKRLARATTPVRQGRFVTKTLRLSKKGRKAIRRGTTKKVTLELRLPDGQKLKRSIKLKRRR